MGWPTVFVRLTGCPLRCGYCDTAYAFHGGEYRGLDEVADQVAGYGASRVCVTGGEPLAQPACLPLLARLCDVGYQVSLETSGGVDVSGVDPRVIKVMDLKTPGSGEAAKNRWENLVHLNPADQVKFVICDRADYEWARAQVGERRLDRWQVLFSPSHGQLPPAQLADWVLADGLPVRFQLQMHKYIWGDLPGK